MMVVITASAFFLSRMIPTTPRTKAMGTEIIMIGPARAFIGLPQPPPQSLSRIITAGMTQRKAADIFPRRILLSLNSVTIVYFIISAIEGLDKQELFEVSGVAEPSCNADLVHVVEEGDCEFSGSVEEVFEFYTFEHTVLFDVFGEAFFCFFNSVIVEVKVFVDAGDVLLLDEDFDGFGYPVGGDLSYLSNFIWPRGIEKIVLQDFFDGVDQFLLGGVEGFGVCWEGKTVFVLDQFLTS